MKFIPLFLLCSRSLIYYGQQLIFPINAKTPDAEDHKVAEELTKAILRVASSLEPRKTPISWFEFEKHIHMFGKKTFMLEGVFRI